MRQKRLSRALLIATLLVGSGCQATRKVGQFAIGVPIALTKGLIEGILDTDETILEKERRLARDRAWKQHWRDHPNDSPAMHEAFKDDYE